MLQSPIVLGIICGDGDLALVTKSKCPRGPKLGDGRRPHAHTDDADPCVFLQGTTPRAPCGPFAVRASAIGPWEASLARCGDGQHQRGIGRRAGLRKARKVPTDDQQVARSAAIGLRRLCNSWRELSRLAGQARRPGRELVGSSQLCIVDSRVATAHEHRGPCWHAALERRGGHLAPGTTVPISASAILSRRGAHEHRHPRGHLVVGCWGWGACTHTRWGACTHAHGGVCTCDRDAGN
mmetsp:Transcript_14633/g.30636  ORF Transcript_14633/g.30636 Transcript_14633/m.30636 type:complete len:238 (+) Transcript_14633:194-907(+)